MVNVGCLLFLLMLIAPYHFQLIKLVLVLILLIPYIGKIISKESFKIDRNILLWIYVYVFMGIFYITYAIIRGNPAPIKYFPTYVIWPILFFLIALLVDKDIFLKLIKCMRYALTIIALTGIVAFIYLNITVDLESFIFGFGAAIRPGFPFLAIYSGAITSMIFLYVFFLVLYLLDKRFLKRMDKFNLIIGFIFIFATSRRVIFIILALTVILSILFIFVFEHQYWKSYKKNIAKKIFVFSIFILIIGGVVIQLELFEFELLFEFIGDAIGDDSSGINYDPRLLQFDALVQGWTDNPIMGNGTGVDAEVVRSELPGTYELSYVALLFERGLFGITIYALQFIILNIWMILSLKNDLIPTKYGIAVLIAFDMFLFANATNPYLNAFDHLWVLFIVLAMININKKRYNENLCNNQGI